MERDAQRYAGLIVAETIQYVKEAILSGVNNTLALDNMAEVYMRERNVFPACKGYRPAFHAKAYEYSTCLSINSEIVHGVPGCDKNICDGDVVSIDIVGRYEGWHADAAITFFVGEVSQDAKRLIDLTEMALAKGIEQAVAGKRTGDIGYAIQSFARQHGLGIAKYLSGHGIGREIHSLPSLPNLGTPNTGQLLEAGMSICIEPMLTLGGDDTCVAADTWAVVTADKSLSAHFEHTILLAEDGESEILTQIQL